MRRWLWGLLLVLILGGFLVWAETPLRPEPEALTALQPGPNLQVTGEKGWIFRPSRQEPQTGLIFYPGARVDPRAYALAARAIAEHGYLVIIPAMPFNLAVFDADRAAEVIAAFPEVEHWAVGGHSLGGAMAARFSLRHIEQVQGLVLWAAYPASDDDLSLSDLAVVSIFGTCDGLVQPDQIQESRSRLPQGTIWVPIEGGNHAQFGRYGQQPGDKEALISPQDQQAQAVQATLELLARLGDHTHQEESSIDFLAAEEGFPAHLPGTK